MHERNPDRAHDPAQAAADALTELGHTPGDDPHGQLQHLAGDIIARVQQAQDAFTERPSGAAALALAELFTQCAAALSPLAETQLDDMEQEALAAQFGLDTPERD